MPKKYKYPVRLDLLSGYTTYHWWKEDANGVIWHIIIERSLAQAYKTDLIKDSIVIKSGKKAE